MPAQADAPPPFLTGSLLGTPHAAFSRQGGVSEGPFASLNLSHHVGDAPDNVRENRRRALAALAGLPGDAEPLAGLARSLVGRTC